MAVRDERPVLINGKRDDRMAGISIQIRVVHAPGIADDRVGLSVAPIDKPLDNRLLARIACGKVQGIGTPLINDSSSGNHDTWSDIRHGDAQTV
ncbi:hypothetical protein KOR42_50060 [Thalassoglobus neptunius]|uniref:Uncharacterized protein n=1 Tax=Thalassoglobus neptunius TaxID=1938619 RepID=A0A5C5VQI4_9PLAN|nr:hypothetical protein KOR42_50060 [Thalassoglobus neptunius]